MNTTRALTTVLAAALLIPACRADMGDVDADTESQHATSASLVEGSPEALGVMAFLNDAATTLSVLDHDVPLPSNAAANIIAHRDGADGVFGTSDDDLFDDVAELLRVKYVGPARVEAIVAYALAHGYVPSGDDLLGVYDGVSFTVDEAAATLALANTASASTLDDEIALDSRAVGSILDARTIASMLELSGLYFVGTSALTKLKNWATVEPALADEGDDCANSAACKSGLECIGIPYDGSPAIGKCADTSPIPGEGDACGHYSGACASEELECAGTTIYSGEGYCRPLYMFGAYETNTSVAIPDNSAVGATAEVVVYGLASVPEDIMVTLYIDHPRPQDLVVTLSSTNGSSDVLWNHPNSPDYYLPSNGLERDNEVNAKLTLHVVDSVSGMAGQLNGFKVLISSRWD
jgi:hypothetical protein